MLVLNIKNGFDVIGTYIDEKGLHKIILEKNLLTNRLKAKDFWKFKTGNSFLI